MTPRPPQIDYSSVDGDGAEDNDEYAPFLHFEGGDQRDYVRLPRRGGWLRRFVLSAGVLMGVALVVLAGVTWWGIRQIDPPGPPGEEVRIDIPTGATADDIATILESEDVITNAMIFRGYLRLRGKEASRYQAGQYAFAESSSMNEALSALEEGPVPIPVADLTLPEGLTVAQIAERIGEIPWFTTEAAQAALSSGEIRSAFQPPEVATLEGLVFPETYQVAEGSAEAEAVQRAVGQLETVAAELDLAGRADALGRTPYEVITIASLIEREARIPEDRPKIARVIYNRLEEDMRLDIDATVLYALGRTSGELTQSDLEVDSPYNTRRYPGLPPTPIAAPGRASLEAALAPAEGDWLFYVIEDEEGGHYFTESYQDFLRAADEAREKGLI